MRKLLVICCVLFFGNNQLNAQCTESLDLRSNTLIWKSACHEVFINNVKAILEKHIGSTNEQNCYNLKNEVIKIKFKKYKIQIIAPYNKEILHLPLKNAFDEIKKLNP